jgi:hypothetical protein
MFIVAMTFEGRGDCGHRTDSLALVVGLAADPFLFVMSEGTCVHLPGPKEDAPTTMWAFVVPAAERMCRFNELAISAERVSHRRGLRSSLVGDAATVAAGAVATFSPSTSQPIPSPGWTSARSAHEATATSSRLPIARFTNATPPGDPSVRRTRSARQGRLLRLQPAKRAAGS